MTTTLVVIAGGWGLVALVAALWLGSAMRRADRNEQLRQERDLDDGSRWLVPDDTDPSDRDRRHIA